MRARALAVALVAAAASLAPAPARAQQAADVVSLKNGGMLRGTVVAIEPGKEVTILVTGTTEARTLPWAEVERVDRAGVAAPAASSVAAPLPEATPAEPGLGAPRLHIHTDTPGVTLYGDDGLTTRPICPAPCDCVIDGRLGQSFYFGGEGISNSPRFQLATRFGSVEARVAAGSSVSAGNGVLMIIFGGLGFVTGASILLTGALVHSNAMEVGGGITGGVGTPLLVGGIALIAVSGRTKFDLLPPGQGAASGAKAAVVRPSLTANGFRLTF